MSIPLKFVHCTGYPHPPVLRVHTQFFLLYYAAADKMYRFTTVNVLKQKQYTAVHIRIILCQTNIGSETKISLWQWYIHVLAYSISSISLWGYLRNMLGATIRSTSEPTYDCRRKKKQKIHFRPSQAQIIPHKFFVSTVNFKGRHKKIK